MSGINNATSQNTINKSLSFVPIITIRMTITFVINLKTANSKTGKNPNISTDVSGNFSIKNVSYTVFRGNLVKVTFDKTDFILCDFDFHWINLFLSFTATDEMKISQPLAQSINIFIIAYDCLQPTQ
jgi:hypothetical protein